MSYLDKIKNKELVEYFQILSSIFPNFLDKYIETDELMRLSKIGQFCGCDYTKLHSCKYWYSRLDHSIACALMVWNFTSDKKQTLSALFHDLGTPVFSHCVDIMMNDSEHQESSEREVSDILLDSNQIMTFLRQDNIKIEDVINIEKYPIVENDKPKICADRLEGVLHTGLIWCHFWGIDDIRNIYSDIVVLKNEYNEDEIGFKDISTAEIFFEGVNKYGIVMQQNEDKFTMHYIAKNLEYFINNNYLSVDDLYKMSELDIIDLIKSNVDLAPDWHVFENASKLIRTNLKPKKGGYRSLRHKKRYVVPLVLIDGKANRLNEVSSVCRKLINEFIIFKDSKYCYIDGMSNYINRIN